MKQQDISQKLAETELFVSTDALERPLQDKLINMDRARKERLLYEAQEQEAFQEEVDYYIETLVRRRDVDGALVDFLTRFRSRLR